MQVFKSVGFNMQKTKGAEMSDINNKTEFVVGIKQTLRMIDKNCIMEIYIAEDADFYIVGPVVRAAEAGGIPVRYISSRRKLGRICSIDVGAAAAGRLK